MFGNDWHSVDVDGVFAVEEENVFIAGGTMSVAVIRFDGLMEKFPVTYRVPLSQIQAFLFPRK